MSHHHAGGSAQAFGGPGLQEQPAAEVGKEQEEEEEEEEEEEMPRARCPMPPHPSQLLHNEPHSAGASLLKGPSHDLGSLLLLPNESHSAGALMAKGPSHNLDSLQLLPGSTPSNAGAHSSSSTGAGHAGFQDLPETTIPRQMDDGVMELRTPEALSSAHGSPTAQPVYEHPPTSGLIEPAAGAAQDAGGPSAAPVSLTCGSIREHSAMAEQTEHDAVQDQESGSSSPASENPAGQTIYDQAPKPGQSGSQSESAAGEDNESGGLSSAARSPASQPIQFSFWPCKACGS